MNLNKLINIRVIFLVLAWMTFPFPVISAEVDISRFEQQCKNITAQQRQLAAAAGYDIEAACSSIKNISSDDSKDEIGDRKSVV